jgi:menaquinone-dependent protoporphyrinogen oxidase
MRALAAGSFHGPAALFFASSRSFRVPIFPDGDDENLSLQTEQTDPTLLAQDRFFLGGHMSPRRILIIFGTSYGQTAKIAGRIRDVLEQRGHDATVANAAEQALAVPLASFEGIIVGSSIIARGHQKSIERFVRTELGLLNAVPSAFYSVSASAGSKDPAGRAAAERVRDDFLKRVGWQPRVRASIAGAINYTRYNPLLRLFMKWASRKSGGSIDTSRDHEYTDWTQVERFATDVAELVETWPTLLTEVRKPETHPPRDSVALAR